MNVAIGCIIQPGEPQLETHVLNTQVTFKLQMPLPLRYGEKKNQFDES
jgi:hypothetical protein